MYILSTISGYRFFYHSLADSLPKAWSTIVWIIFINNLIVKPAKYVEEWWKYFHTSAQWTQITGANQKDISNLKLIRSIQKWKPIFNKLSSFYIFKFHITIYPLNWSHFHKYGVWPLSLNYHVLHFVLFRCHWFYLISMSFRNSFTVTIVYPEKCSALFGAFII